jgi:predicted nicotinamide N-methyase
MADDDRTDDYNVELWTREETPMLTVRVATDQSVRIAQYGSDDARWGIYSCIWDGGLGLIAYLRKNPALSKNALVIDLGSGTGVVGLGAAAIGFTNVVVTDLREALDLMIENARLNPKFNVSVEEITWGEPLSESVKQRISSTSEIVLVGADIVYRQNLFDPLLTTLEMLWNTKVKCILATQSIRSHLEEFYARALERGFMTIHLANVLVPQGMSDDLPKIMDPSNVKADNIVHILELTRLPT